MLFLFNILLDFGSILILLFSLLFFCYWISIKIELNIVPILLPLEINPLWCITIIKLSLHLNIIGEPDEPYVVEALYLISLLLINFISPYENDISLLFGYCNINILWFFNLLASSEYNLK